MIQQILHADKIKTYNINNFGITFDVTLLNAMVRFIKILCKFQTLLFTLEQTLENGFP